MPSAKDAHSLVTYYETAYRKHYGNKPNVNRYKARWGFDSVLMDMPLKDAKALIDYYVESGNARNRDLEWFFYNYDKLKESHEKIKDDVAKTKVLMEESRKRAEEWRARGKQGITGN